MKFNIIKKVGFVVLIFATLSTCERDDICPEDIPTTPRLILEFYDVSNQENTKIVPDLFIQGIGNSQVLTGFSGSSDILEVQLPLKTDENSTSFRFITNYELVDDNGTPNDTSDDIFNGNEDIITINYITENVYVSRACGYKTVYKAVNIQFDPDDTERWIVLAQPLNDNQSIEDETTTHFKFFH
ncbi:DUF6452 family protein [Psychroserpens mesophilus]|uniref:DUF6452 family protein n=1 Tax=Psychroserpens mesophilus TaxID=325473 RepID=UPI000694F098|nr:DUF6452 family protein [Psychroserpens mesophilus]